MIDEKKIEAAATSLVKETRSREEEYYLFMENFKAAVKWAQEEFVKSLWYAPVVEAEPRRDIIAISKKGMVYAFCFEYDDDWRQTFRDCNIERFCYLDDVLPKNEDK